jgi:hypothetical protein
MQNPRRHSKLSLDIAVGIVILAINVSLFFVIPKLPLPLGRLGQALGYLTALDIMLVPIVLYNRLWLASTGLVMLSAFFIDLLMRG